VATVTVEQKISGPDRGVFKAKSFLRLGHIIRKASSIFLLSPLPSRSLSSPALFSPLPPLEV